ncbi:MAG: hypothetical protein JW795_07455 [Chitinivibrionales bacterium]|nr:hypothetical protein [Chitinivibrionales bacterium]
MEIADTSDFIIQIVYNRYGLCSIYSKILIHEPNSIIPVAIMTPKNIRHAIIVEITESTDGPFHVRYVL